MFKPLLLIRFKHFFPNMCIFDDNAIYLHPHHSHTHPLPHYHQICIGTIYQIPGNLGIKLKVSDCRVPVGAYQILKSIKWNKTNTNLLIQYVLFSSYENKRVGVICLKIAPIVLFLATNTQKLFNIRKPNLCLLFTYR